MVNNIPQIIDESYLNHFNKKAPIAAFYQLQFIFNQLDKSCFLIRFHEMFLNMTKLIKKIKVPKYENLAASIRSKNVSLIIQHKRYSQFLKQKEIKESEGDESKNDTLQEKATNPSKNIQYEMPIKFIDRYNRNIINKKIESYIKDVESFWNPSNEDYSINDEVLVNSKINEKNINIDSIYSLDSMEFSTSEDYKSLFFKIPKQNSKAKLDKFFVYKNNKWEMNLPVIEKFFNKKIKNKKSPIVLISNSYEKNIISMMSNLIDTLYPDLDDDDIYVYAISSRTLNFLNYDIESSDNGSQIKPVFLILHVQNTTRIENIKAILDRIYMFLTMICDIEIVIFNEYYHHQIDQINKLRQNYIELNEKEKNDDESNENKRIKDKIQKQIESQRNYNADDNEDDDFDDNEKQDEIINIINNYFDVSQKQNEIININSMNNDFADIDTSLLNRKIYYIFLLNNEKLDINIKKMKSSRHRKNLLYNLHGSEDCYYINVDNPITYELFLQTLNESALKHDTRYEDFRKRLSLFPLTQVCTRYIDMKNNKLKIEEDICRRIKILSKSTISKVRLIKLLSNEINIIIPKFDKFCLEKCREAILNREKNVFNEILVKETEISSRNNLKYLSKIIDDQIYITPQMKVNYMNNHLNFLKEEFYSILKTMCDKNIFIQLYQDNYYIIANQYDKDIKIINQMIGDIETRNAMSIRRKTVKLTYKLKSATNYTIRETENVREIKLMVEAGCLKDAIDQDF